MNENNTCANCIYWLKVDYISDCRDELQAHWGLCKRFPPSLKAENNDFGIAVNTSPVTDGDEWCGEHSTGDKQ